MILSSKVSCIVILQKQTKKKEKKKKQKNSHLKTKRFYFPISFLRKSIRVILASSRSSFPFLYFHFTNSNIFQIFQRKFFVFFMGFAIFSYSLYFYSKIHLLHAVRAYISFFLLFLSPLLSLSFMEMKI